jgi:hypothetical protein
MYSSIEPFTQGYYSVIGDTAVSPEEKTGLANACLSLGDYLLWQTDFVDLCQEQAKRNLAHGLQITADVLMGRGPFEDVDKQLQYPLQGHGENYTGKERKFGN